MATYTAAFTLTLSVGASKIARRAAFTLLADAAADLDSDTHGYIDADVGMTPDQFDLTITLDDNDEQRALIRLMAAGRTILDAIDAPAWESFTVSRDALTPA